MGLTSVESFVKYSIIIQLEINAWQNANKFNDFNGINSFDYFVLHQRKRYK